jgi:hypothetical protein
MAKGKKTGGRVAGVPNKATAEIKALAQAHAAVAIKELARLAVEAQSEQARVAAIKELLDRGYGKSAQAVTGEGGEGAVQLHHTVKFAIVDPQR